MKRLGIPRREPRRGVQCVRSRCRLAPHEIDRAERIPGLGVVAVDVERLSLELLGAVGVAARIRDGGEIVPGAEVAGTLPHHLLQRRRRAIGLPQPHQRQRQLEPCRRELRTQRNRPLERAPRLFEPSDPAPQIAFEKHDLGDVRIAPLGALQRLQRRRHVARFGPLQPRHDQVVGFDLPFRIGRRRSRIRRSLRSDVSERQQPLFEQRIRSHGGRCLRRRAPRNRRNGALERRCLLPACAGVVRPFARIGDHVVQLRIGRLNVFQPPGPHRSELAPAELIARQERFRVGLERRRVVLRQERQQIDAVRRGPAWQRRGAAGRGDDRRQLVDNPRHAAHVARPQAGRLQDPRYPQRGVVDKKAMRLLAMVAQRLAVIGRDADRRLVPEPVLMQKAEEPGQRAVGG